MTPLSILELVRVTQETDARGALDNARDLAAHAERLGLSPHLGGGASQHAGHRQRRDVGRARPSRRRDDDHPGRRRRHHAAQPCALCHRRAVRNAGAALSRPHRPRARPRPGHRPAHAARPAPPAGGRRERSRRTFSSCRPSWPRPLPASASRRCRRRERKCRCGSSDRAISARCSPPSSGCPTPSPRISPPTCSSRRSKSIAAASSRRNSSTGPMPWSASTSSPPTATRRRAVSPRPSKCRSPTSSAARGA